MSSSDPKDDVDRLFSCFKCGISPPQSALKERKPKSRRASVSATGEPSESPRVESPLQGASLIPQVRDLADKEELGPSTSMAIKFNCRKKISPVVFYGSPHGVPVKRPLQLLKLLREIHVDLVDQNDFSQRKEIWATFPRQEEAINFAKTHKKVFVFSYQDHLNGQRRFLASTYEEFWRRYESMNAKVRHHYEVIQEGSPCHLYFDLEFDKRANPNKDVDEMVDILVSVTLDALHDKYSIRGECEWVIELDSSTKEKFSRHLIIRIPRTAFKDNSHVGEFVYEVSSRIVDLRGSNPQLEKLYIRKESAPDSLCQLFLDTAVYTRNRCFRLAFSSKAGKNSFLLPTRRFKCKNMHDRQVFMESLICGMDIDCNRLLICKMDLDFKKTLCFDSEINESHNVPREDGSHHYTSKFTGTYFTGKSPFPSLDNFVESIASNGNVSGKIRSWYWFSAYGLMVYSMSRNRYCERIGREHKSNHVMYVIDFQRAGYYQKCYDPDCKGYRSPMRPIPSDVIPDGVTLFHSTHAENYTEVMNVNFDLKLYEANEEASCANVEMITDSCEKDSGWWQEAVRYADCVENMRKAPNYLLDDGWVEDQDWWMDADKLITEVEEQIS